MTAVANTMNCIEIGEYGPASGLAMAQRDIPQVGKNDVLIKVHAAGVNRPDIAQRQGFYPPPPGASDIPGLEVAGMVMDLGAGVEDIVIGDRICALLTGGGYAEYAVAPVEQCLLIPAGLSYIEAAALPEVFFTVWSNVFDRAALKPGESFLVHGGSSGVGSAAIQLAKFQGATVYATAGSEEKCQFCLDLGAHKVINYRSQEFVEELRKETGGRGVDVILDMVGGDYVQRNMNLAAVDGRIVSIAFLQGAITELDLTRLMMKRLTLTGSTLRARDSMFKGAIAKALKEHVWPALASGTLQSKISKVFPLEQAKLAHQLMESSEHMGNIVLEVVLQK